jgi:tagaturonate epimerase
MQLAKYSIGVGDRFGHQAKAQLQACVLAARDGVEVVPVWNKSNREHTLIGSEPCSVRGAADQAVRALGWTKAYYVDADHINIATVDRFLAPSDFFTIDVAEFIGKPASSTDVRAFLSRHPELAGTLEIAGISEAVVTSPDSLALSVSRFFTAVREAGRIYRHIVSRKQGQPFITEISMDETDMSQPPAELLVILALIADEQIPIQTIAPKFTGRFNKGVDFVGDREQFAAEFEDDLATIAHAVETYALPRNLKLSVHSGSDKFSIYSIVSRALQKFDAGVHLKTAGTTWLEELIGLAEAGGEGLDLVKEIYSGAYHKRQALCEPYATVIDIDSFRLPSPSKVGAWSSEEFVSALRHDPACPKFDPNVRQLLHVGFKIAAGMGERYLKMLDRYEPIIARNVTENLYQRHIRPLFLCPANDARNY